MYLTDFATEIRWLWIINRVIFSSENWVSFMVVTVRDAWDFESCLFTRIVTWKYSSCTRSKRGPLVQLYPLWIITYSFLPNNCQIFARILMKYTYTHARERNQIIDFYTSVLMIICLNAPSLLIFNILSIQVFMTDRKQTKDIQNKQKAS